MVIPSHHLQEGPKLLLHISPFSVCKDDLISHLCWFKSLNLKQTTSSHSVHLGGHMYHHPVISDFMLSHAQHTALFHTVVKELFQTPKM
jgi:hypothetical protein